MLYLYIDKHLEFMKAFTQQDKQMIEDLKAFAKAINFQLNSPADLPILLKKWVNHRVKLTDQF